MKNREIEYDYNNEWLKIVIEGIKNCRKKAVKEINSKFGLLRDNTNLKEGDSYEK